MGRITRIIWVLALVVFLRPGSAGATIMVGDVVSSGKTFINYFSNKGYIPRDHLIFFDQIPLSLERSRIQLVKENKLEDISVLVEVPSPIFSLKYSSTRTEKRSDCETSSGDSGYPAQKIGRCYYIYYVGEPSFAGFQSALSSFAAGPLQNPAPAEQYLTPVWSPDSNQVATGVWEEGLVYFEIYSVQTEGGKASEKISALAHPGVWSPDGRYFSFASRTEIQVFDTQTETTRKINPGQSGSNSSLEILLSYDLRDGKLLYAFDKNVLAGYDVYEYDLVSGQSALRASDLDSLSWPVNLLPQSTGVTSPDGRLVARIDNRISGSSRSVVRLAPASEKSPGPVVAQIASGPENFRANWQWILIGAGVGILLTVPIWFFIGHWYVAAKERRSWLENNPLRVSR